MVRTSVKPKRRRKGLLRVVTTNRLLDFDLVCMEQEKSRRNLAGKGTWVLTRLGRLVLLWRTTREEGDRVDEEETGRS